MNCQKCGNQLNEGAVFCPKCGAPIASVNSAYNTPVSNKKWPIIVLTALIAVIAIILVCIFSNNDPLKRIKKNLDGTWTASFENGAYECRLHFSSKGVNGSAMLINHARDNEYFEVVAIGKTDFNTAPESVHLVNIGNPDKSEHDYEVDVIPIKYIYDSNQNKLSLESDFLAGYLKAKPHLFFSKLSNDSYYDGVGERVYTWEALFD